jgi:WD40 repeat protein
MRIHPSIGVFCALAISQYAFSQVQEMPPSLKGPILAISKNRREALSIDASNNFVIVDLQKHTASEKKFISPSILRITPSSAAVAEDQRRYIGAHFFRDEKPFAIVTRNQTMGLGQAEVWDLTKTNFVSKIGLTFDDVTKMIKENPNVGMNVFTTNLFPGTINRCLLVPDNRTLVVCCGDLGAYFNMDNGLTSWDLETGKCVCWFQNVRGAVFDIALTPDGRKLVSAGFDNDVRLWDTRTSKLMTNLKDCLPRAGTTGDFLHIVALSDDGRYAAAVYGTYSVSLLIWEVGSGKLLNRLSSIGMVSDLAFSPDANEIAVAGMATVTLYKVPSLTKQVSFLIGSGFPVSKVEFLSNTVLITSGGDSEIHWWSVKR